MPIAKVVNSPAVQETLAEKIKEYVEEIDLSDYDDVYNQIVEVAFSKERINAALDKSEDVLANEEIIAEKIEIDRVEITFRNLNQAQYITEFKIDVPTNPGEGRAVSMPGGEGGPPQKPSSSVLKQCQISWRIDNPDQDQLYLELLYQEEGGSLWVPIAKGDEIRGSRYQWDASGLSDGWYRIKLTVSDNPGNTDQETFATEQISNPILIDTTKPELNFTVSESLLSGEAKDATSVILRIEYAIDDGDFKPATSLDGVDYALCRIRLGRIELADFWQVGYPRKLQVRLHAAARDEASCHEAAQLHHDLGRFYAEHAARRGRRPGRGAFHPLVRDAHFPRPRRLLRMYSELRRDLGANEALQRRMRWQRPFPDTIQAVDCCHAGLCPGHWAGDCPVLRHPHRLRGYTAGTAGGRAGRRSGRQIRGRKWTVVRQLGGDDTGQGEILSLRPNTVQRVTVYRYR
jgi:hypothetical protein